MIKVFLKEPGKGMEAIEIQNTLEAFQDLVGGYIECVTMVPGELVMIIDEEGRMKGKDVNLFFRRADDFIFGTAVFAGVSGEDFASIPDKYMAGIPGVIPIWQPEIVR